MLHLLFWIAGTYQCPNSNWAVEYTGYVMAYRYNKYKGEFVCVDRNPEKVTLRNNLNQAAFYPTEFQCGTLPCPPYNNDREVGAELLVFGRYASHWLLFVTAGMRCLFTCSWLTDWNSLYSVRHRLSHLWVRLRVHETC